MYMCIVHARIPLIPRLLEEVNFTKKVIKNIQSMYKLTDKHNAVESFDCTYLAH